MFLESGVEKRLLSEAGCLCEQNSNRNCKQNHWKMLSKKQTVADFLKKFQRIPKPSKFSSLKKSWSRRLRSFETRFFFLFLSFFICIFLFYFLLHRAMCHLSDLSCGGPTMYVKGKNSVMHQTVERSSPGSYL